MSEMETALPGDETADESVDSGASQGDNSIRAILERELAAQATPEADEESTEETSSDEAVEPIADDDAEPLPPRSWTEAERAVWGELPRAAQDAISRRERAYQAGLKTDAEVRKVIEPLAERLQGTGVHPDQYLQNLLVADRFITDRPLEAALAIIQRHGLTEQIADRLKGYVSEDDAPQRSNESARIAELEAQLRYQAAYQSAAREWDEFARTHPDAVELKEVIASKIGANPSISYADAYAESVKLVRKFNGSIAQAQEAAEIDASTKAAAKGKRLNLPKGQSSAPAKPTSTGNLNEDIRAAWRQLRM